MMFRVDYSDGTHGPKHPGNRQLCDKRGRPDASAHSRGNRANPKVATFCAAIWLTFTLPLTAMSVNELKTEWQALFDAPAPNNSRTFLEGRLAYRIQELTYGGPDKQTRRLLDLLADEVDGTLTRKAQIADPRNPVVGTKLIREWDGVAHTVTVLREGFDWDGRRLKSLSAVARAITGTRWNGYRFFGLRERKRGEA